MQMCLQRFLDLRQDFSRVCPSCVEDEVAAVEQGPNARVAEPCDKAAQVSHVYPVRPTDVDAAQQCDVPIRQPAILSADASRSSILTMIRYVELIYQELCVLYKGSAGRSTAIKVLPLSAAHRQPF